MVSLLPLWSHLSDPQMLGLSFPAASLCLVSSFRDVVATELKQKDAPLSVERVPGTLSIASKSVQVNGAATVSRDLICVLSLSPNWCRWFTSLWALLCQELRKPSYAEICQRVKDTQSSQPPPPTKEAKPACTAPAGEERKCADASIPAGEAKSRETYLPSSKASLAPSGRPARDARRPAGRWASPPPHPGKSSSKEPPTPPKSPQ